MYGWAAPVQSTVSSQLLPVAGRAGPASEVLVDTRHTTLRVAVPLGTTPLAKQAIRAAVLSTQIGQSLQSHRWSIVVEPPHPRPYTSHVRWSQVAQSHPRLGGGVCVLRLSREEVDALRHSLRCLQGDASNSRIIATFGMGGLPLLHWLTLPTSGLATPAAAALANSSRYHLLPGLNWSGTQREKNTFKAWLSTELGTPGQVLIFDTGTKGNGIRQAGSLAREAVEGCAPVAGASVAIAGLVDGPSRKPERYRMLGTNRVGVDVTIDYTRVPHLPTEDNGLLLGYDADRKTGVLHPVSGLILYRIEETPALLSSATRVLNRFDGRFTWLRDMVTRCGRRISRLALVASSSGANTISDLVRGPLQPRGSRVHRDVAEWGTAAILLAHAQADELEALENAIAARLVTPPVLISVTNRHRREQEHLLSHRWSRERKRVVVVGS